MRTTLSNLRQPICGQTDAAKRVLRFALGLLFVFVSLAAYAVNESDLLPANEAFPLTVNVSGPQQVTLDFGTKPGYYLYQDRFSFAVDGVPVKPDPMPPAESKNDPTFGMVQVYHRPVQIHIPLPHAIVASIRLSVTSQGCADLGVCYPPLTRSYRIAANGVVTSISNEGNATAGATEFAVVGENRSIAVFGLNLQPANGLGVPELLGFLLAGLLMAGTVCMYPLIPIVTTVIGGGQQRPTVWRGFALSLAYVQGLAVTYAVAGTVAALIGIPLVAVTQKPWVLAAFGLLMVGLALGMFGLVRLQMPTGWQTRLTEWSNRLPGGRIVPVFVMGMLSALIVGPCSTPALAGCVAVYRQQPRCRRWSAGLVRDGHRNRHSAAARRHVRRTRVTQVRPLDGCRSEHAGRHAACSRIVVRLFVAAGLAADGVGRVAVSRLRHDAACPRPAAAGRPRRASRGQSNWRTAAGRGNCRTGRRSVGEL